MQTSSQLHFKACLYYWSKLYSKSIRKGGLYKTSQSVFFNFVKFSAVFKEARVLLVFQVSAKEQPVIQLTQDLNISIVELPKFNLDLESLQNPFEYWMYVLKEAGNLKGNKMKALKEKSKDQKALLN